MTNLQLRQQVGGRCPALSYTRQPVHVSQGRADITVAQQVPLAVDVADPELAQLTDPQAAAVADLQHHVVLAVGASRQYPGDLRSGQQLRYALRLLRYRESHFQLIALEHLHQQKADGMNRLTTARCTVLSLASQVLHVTSDLNLIKPVRRLAIGRGISLKHLQYCMET